MFSQHSLQRQEFSDERFHSNPRCRHVRSISLPLTYVLYCSCSIGKRMRARPLVLSREIGLCSNSTLKLVCQDVLKYIIFISLHALAVLDLTSLFDWNTKQLFVMLIAHYKTKRNVRHHSILQYVHVYDMHAHGVHMYIRTHACTDHQSGGTLGQDHQARRPCRYICLLYKV